MAAVAAEAEAEHARDNAGDRSAEGDGGAEATAWESIKALALVLFLPSLCFGLADGVALPSLPLFARELGCNDALAGSVVAMQPLGKLFGDIPAGMMFGWLGCKQTMTLGLLGATACSLLAACARDWSTLAGVFFFVGICEAHFTVSRTSYMRGVVPTQNRGRVTSLLGGVNRFARVIGPTVGGTIAQAGGLRAPFFLRCGILLLAVATLTIHMPATEVRLKGAGGHNIISTLRKYWRIYLTAGLSALLLNLIRGSRNILVPLKARALRLSHQQTGLCVSLGYLFDTMLFGPTGWLMDKFGRRRVGLPAFFLLSLGLLATGTLANSPLTLQLGVFQLLCDLGSFLGPVMVGVVSEDLTLDSSAIVMACCGFFGFAWFSLTVRESLQSGPSPGAPA